MNKLIEGLRTKVKDTSQVAVAGDLGITQAMVSRLLSGKAKPGIKTLTAVLRSYPDLAEAAAAYVFGDDGHGEER